MKNMATKKDKKSNGKIAIVSDSHDNLPNIEKFLSWVKKNKIKTIIHCGDLAAPSIIAKEFGPKFKGQFHFIHGNVADRELNEKLAADFDNITCHGDMGELKIDKKKIAFWLKEANMIWYFTATIISLGKNISEKRIY
jgi:predicted phosphodiesterase